MQAGALATLSDADLLAEVRALEVARRRLQAADHRMVTGLVQRCLPEQLGTRSVANLLQAMLRLSPYEAKRRVLAAETCGPRVSLTGHALDPILPADRTVLCAEGTTSSPVARRSSGSPYLTLTVR